MLKVTHKIEPCKSSNFFVFVCMYFFVYIYIYIGIAASKSHSVNSKGNWLKIIWCIINSKSNKLFCEVSTNLDHLLY